ncbi:hypothetical protein [Williamsia herbipolensis]|uniref:hypothetical protein n=1 Tax=Williamsia herbipolensis TaxID=1603258 RepID=UPI0005F83C8B|nr:hypothetical protein [Williamsia herbipolensis]
MFATTSTSFEPASNRFATPLPRALRASAETLDWRDFCAGHAVSGSIRLGTWSAVAAHDDLVDFRATLAVGDRICAVDATAVGPLGAATAMLHSLGVAIEITGLHQQSVCGDTVTFVECDIDGRRAWGMGIAADPALAGVGAMIAAANRLR